MALSGVFTFNMNRDELITDALIEIGGLAIGGTPSAAQLAHATSRLNSFVKALQAEHIYLYKLTTGTVDTTGSQDYITYPSDIRRIKHMWSTIDNTNTSMTKRAQKWFDDLYTPQSPATPTDYMIDKGAGRIYLYPTPAEIYTLNYRGETILDDFTVASDNLALPQTALDFIVKTLAYELSVPYGLDAQRVQMAQARAKVAKAAYLSHYNQQVNADDEPNAPKGVLIV